VRRYKGNVEDAARNPVQRYKGKNYGEGGAMIFCPIFLRYLWREGSSEEHSQDWLCHKCKSKEPAGPIRQAQGKCQRYRGQRC
jgi:hypothetical protein